MNIFKGKLEVKFHKVVLKALTVNYHIYVNIVFF